ncbi:hypothetical protein OKW41_006156 [Paraburkholderia sp. UCT70]|uniref:hypothetical protein n=1 Tax=Paraburkholderia sp. UCT70 TaxID=2991068 RepID=UPI003D237DE4
MKKLWGFLALFVGAFLFKFAPVLMGAAVGSAAGQSYRSSNKEAEIDKQLVATMNEINKNTPMMLDKITRLDTTIGLHHQFTYVYTTVGYKGADIPRDAFVAQLRPYLVNGLCTGDAMKVFRDNNIPVNYSYKGEDGVAIAVITITNSDCKRVTGAL